MSRLIDADALHKVLSAKQKWVVHCGDKYNEGYTSDQVHFAIDDAPTIDQVKHGYWINISISANDNESSAECDLCGAIVHNNFSSIINYCPNCGAKMDADRDYEHAVEQLEHDMTFEPTYNPEDGSM